MIKVKGSMKPKWISTIARGPEVAAAVKEKSDLFKTELEQRMKMRYPEYPLYHYGRSNLTGTWGPTTVIWPISPMARTERNLVNFENTASGLGLKAKDGA